MRISTIKARPSVRACVIALVLVTSPRVAADVLITEATTMNMGDRTVRGVRSTYIKGSQMRVELVQGDASTATLYDLAAGSTIDLDAKGRRARIHDIAARSAELEDKYPRERVSATVTPTGAAREIAGSPCAEYTFVIKVPLAKDGNPSLSMTGSAWIAKGALGAADYESFAKAAVDRHLVLGYISDNRILLAITRGQTELYRALAQLRGIPYVVEINNKVDGQGFLAGLLNKQIAGSRTSTVTRVEVGPIAEDKFVIPDGWKHDRH